MAQEKVYIAIDLKSFYASQECVERGLDPMTTNLVVADLSRTEKTICLAVTPALKSFGVPGRPRLFEVVEKVGQINAQRRQKAPGRQFAGKSWDVEALKKDPSLALDYIVAPPQMAHYIAASTRIYQIYLELIAPEDIHVYSVDEVFIHATPYLKTYRMTPEALARKLIHSVYEATGITATAGIGSNLYLAKVAMDIVAKRMEADAYGARVAVLSEEDYRRKLWGHRPLTDFWRVGKGYAAKLERIGLYTMGDVARCSLENEDVLYKLFGVNAELLIDHAWGWENCTIADIRAYKPSSHSLSTGQVLQSPYTWEKARLIVKEMTDNLVLDLVEKGLVTDQLTLTLGYDRESLLDPAICSQYFGDITIDPYGRCIPKHAHGTANLPCANASTAMISQAVLALFDRIAHPALLVRRINLTAAHIQPEGCAAGICQLDLFSRIPEERVLEREHRRQKAVVSIRQKYGKNAIFKGMNLEEGATSREHNGQIGGHKA